MPRRDAPAAVRRSSCVIVSTTASVGRRRVVMSVMLVAVAAGRAGTLAVDRPATAAGAEDAAQIAFERLHGVELRHASLYASVRRLSGSGGPCWTG